MSKFSLYTSDHIALIRWSLCTRGCGGGSLQYCNIIMQDVRPPRMRMMFLSRQMSHDPSSPIPCQEIGEAAERTHHPLTRLVSGRSIKMIQQRPLLTREESTISTLSDDVWIEDDQGT